jgi:hypothetical protein
MRRNLRTVSYKSHAYPREAWGHLENMETNRVIGMTPWQLLVGFDEDCAGASGHVYVQGLVRGDDHFMGACDAEMIY